MFDSPNEDLLSGINFSTRYFGKGAIPPRSSHRKSVRSRKGKNKTSSRGWLYGGKLGRV